MLVTSLTSVQGQNTYTLKSVSASVSGTSTLHAWESDVTKVDCKGVFEVSNNTLKTIRDVEVKIPVEGIKSKEGKIMDSKTYEAFKYEENPFILYKTKTAEVVAQGGTAIIKTKGNLTMAGTTREVELDGNWKLLANGDLEVDVSKSLKMTDYNMTPPTAVLGTIKVGDEVTIKIKLTLTASNISKSKS